MPPLFPIHVRTLGGLEELLAAELTALGAEQVETAPRLVRCLGDVRLLYRANLACFLAIRVLRPLAMFTAASERQLYDGVQTVDWAGHLTPDGTLAVDPIVRSSFTTHSLYAAQLVKDAVCDQFRDRTGRRPSVDLESPTLRIGLHLAENKATLYLDASGDSLHKRGYRPAGGEAPLGEVLAAGIVRLSGWNQRDALLDPMCGSGTLVIEAALLARNRPPGLIRRRFGYQNWLDYDRPLHEALLAELRAAERPSTAATILGSDLDPNAIQLARSAAQAAGVQRDVQLAVANFDSVVPPPPPGVLLMNPPYDERMPLAHATAFYQRIGDALKQRYAGYSAWIFTAALDAAKRIGLAPSRRIKLFNGPLECRLLHFEMYAGRGSVIPAQAGFHEPTDSRGSLREPTPAAGTTPSSVGPDAPTSDAGPLDRGAIRDNTDARDSVIPAQAGIHESRFPIDSFSSPSAVPEKWHEQAAILTNRLTRMGKHWGKWARRQQITCYRVYDRDIPEIPLCLDLYEGQLVAAEYVRPHDRSPQEHAAWLDFMLAAAAQALGIADQQAFLRRRQKQRGLAQYERLDRRREKTIVHEGGLKFLVNLSDYLDTGLFLDHRLTRAMVRDDAADRRFLNLFCYTGAFTVYAAAGGAAHTTSVDLSNTYLHWAQENLQLNGFSPEQYDLIRSDALDFLDGWTRRRDPLFDLVVADPPTFSNSKSTPGIWDVQRDHVELLRRVLRVVSPAGKIYFSTNFRRFKFHGEELSGCTIREISAKTVPPDFRNRRIHRCWTIVKS